MTPQSPSKLAPWDLTQFSQSPSAALLCFPEISGNWNFNFGLKFLPFQSNFSFGKTQKSHGAKSGLGCLVTWVIWCFTKKLCTRRVARVGSLWQSCQSPAAQSCGLLNHPRSFHGGIFKLNAKFGADSLLCWLSYFECDGHTVHVLTQWCLLPPWLVHWGRRHSHMHILVHSPWLPGYMDVAQTWANHSCCINNGWTFSKQTSCTTICLFTS